MEEGEITPSVGRSPGGTIVGTSENRPLQSEIPPLRLPSVSQNTSQNSGEAQTENPQLIIEGDKITPLHVANQSLNGPKNIIRLGPNAQVPINNFAKHFNKQTGPLSLSTSPLISQPASTHNQPTIQKSQPTGLTPLVDLTCQPNIKTASQSQPASPQPTSKPDTSISITHPDTPQPNQNITCHQTDTNNRPAADNHLPGDGNGAGSITRFSPSAGDTFGTATNVDYGRNPRPPTSFTDPVGKPRRNSHLGF
ncbi:translation initiation factor IF-2 [Striga asiatica]|uniref:Translation initiation factor IF-2 n=1 Tax=Striga asiatica TaxID=4170 RepID=A0A5A7PSK5_STRAF|nr:translation initiation factor IF-2 [Striga asiatica]